MRQSVLLVLLIAGVAMAAGCSQTESALENPVSSIHSAAAVGQDSPSSSQGTMTASAAKAVICHNDVDDEDPYDSIAIVVSLNSVGKHFTNHGDCYTNDSPGTENCSCAF